MTSQIEELRRRLFEARQRLEYLTEIDDPHLEYAEAEVQDLQRALDIAEIEEIDRRGYWLQNPEDA